MAAGPSKAPSIVPVMTEIIYHIPPTTGKPLVEAGIDFPQSYLHQLIDTFPQPEGLGSLTLETLATLWYLLEHAKH